MVRRTIIHSWSSRLLLVKLTLSSRLFILFIRFRVTELSNNELKEFIFLDSVFYENINANDDKCPHAKVNIFEKKYIIFPYNIDNCHWALIVVCNHKDIVKCIDYVTEGSENGDKKGLKGESPSLILCFDSMSLGLRIKTSKRRKANIRNSILKYLAEEAKIWNLSDHEKLCRLVNEGSCPDLVLPVVIVNGSKSCSVFTIVTTS